MITSQQVVTRHGTAGSRGRPPAARGAAGRPVVRDRRGPARPVPVSARGPVACPSPVTRPAAYAPAGTLRRVLAGVGLTLASAAAVVGLGLLADAGAGAATAAPSVPVVAAP